MKNLILGAGYKLTWDQCKVWVNSIKRSGFDGDIVLVYFGDNEELVKRLRQENVGVFNLPELPQSENVCTARFFAYHSLLSQYNWMSRYKWVIATDVTDVVFQKNPIEYIEHIDFINADKPVEHIASSENLVYGREPWGHNNLNLTYGSDYVIMMQHNTIWNAGVIAASHERMKDITGIIFHMSASKMQHVPGGGGPDQATYNVLLNMKSINNFTSFVPHDNGWACQCGTTMDTSRPYLMDAGLEPLPSFDGEHVVTSKGNPFHIVHQYNRVPQLKEYFEKKYG